MSKHPIAGLAAAAMLVFASSGPAAAEGAAADAAGKPPAQTQPQGPQVSPKLVQPLTQAHSAASSEKWDEALEHIKAAQAVEGRTPFDDYQIDEILGFVQTRKGDYAAAAVTFERTVASGFLPADRLEERLRLLTQLNYEIKQYGKAIEFGNKVLAGLKQPDPELRSLIGRAYYLSGDHRSAIQAMDSTIQDAHTVGKPVEETWLQVLLSSYVELQDNAGIARSLQQLAVQFPKKKYWEDYFRVMKRKSDEDPRMLLNLYRLMSEVNLMQSPEDYIQAARTAMRMGFPGEAVALLEQGKARKVFAGEVETERSRQLMQEAQVAAQADRKSLVPSEAEAKAAKSGEADVQLGIAFMSYGQYDKAIEAIQRGQKKGGLKFPGEADLMLGRALFKLDRKDEAVAAFERVAAGGEKSAGPQAQLATLANLWLVYLRQPAAVST